MKLKAITVVAGKKISFDMKSRKFRDYEELYRLHVEGRLKGTDVGLPCKDNDLVIIDVDVPTGSHAFDGRQWIKDNWDKYPELQDTYRVETPSGGCHFYLKLPPHIDPIIFHPRGQLARGVDVKWKGYVVAPPTPGYKAIGKLNNIKLLSMGLMDRMGYSEELPENPNHDFKVNIPLPKDKALKLLTRLKSIMPHHELSYSEWVEGIFSICAAVDEEELREECIIAFTKNKSFAEGDIEQALAKAKAVDPHGGVGTGTIIKMLNDRDTRVKERSEKLQEAITTDMLYDTPKLVWVEKKDGNSVLPPIDSNANALIEAMFPHDYTKKEDKRYPSLYIDKRKQVLMINDKPSEWTEEMFAYKVLQELQQKHRFIQFKLNHINSGLRMLAMDRTVDTLALKIRTLEWDKKPRIDKFFIDYCDTHGASHEYLRGVGRTFWRSLVYRIVAPGHKCDEMVILQGEEGQAKSSLAEVLSYGHFFACSDKAAFSDRDCLINMHKSAIVEIVEMVALLACDPDQAKGYMTQKNDFVRQMFGKQSVDTPRSFILIGTCNKKHTLTKTHGIRRFLPVNFKGKEPIHLMAIEEDLDQFYAEAYEDFKQGKRNFGLVKKEERDSIVQAHTVDHPWVMHLRPYLEGKDLVTERGLHLHLELSHVFGGGAINIQTNRTLYTVMGHMGWEKDGLNWVKR